MIGLLAGGGFSALSDFFDGSVGIDGPVGLSNDGGGDYAGLIGGVGLTYDAGSGSSVGLDVGFGLFA